MSETKATGLLNYYFPRGAPLACGGKVGTECRHFDTFTYEIKEG